MLAVGKVRLLEFLEDSRIFIGKISDVDFCIPEEDFPLVTEGDFVEFSLEGEQVTIHRIVTL